MIKSLELNENKILDWEKNVEKNDLIEHILHTVSTSWSLTLERNTLPVSKGCLCCRNASLAKGYFKVLSSFFISIVYERPPVHIMWLSEGKPESSLKIIWS